MACVPSFYCLSPPAYPSPSVYTQDQVAKRVDATLPALGEPAGDIFSRRPWQLFWFAAQVVACLELWAQDNTLADALALAKAFLVPCDVMNALWPCPDQEARVGALRERLEHACALARVPPPMHPEYSLPPVLRPEPHGAYAFAT